MPRVRDISSGFLYNTHWYQLGPESSNKISNLWAEAANPGEKIKLTVEPFVTLGMQLLALQSNGVVLERPTVPGVVYLCKKMEQYHFFRVLLSGGPDDHYGVAEFYYLTGERAFSCPYGRNQSWAVLAEALSEHLEVNDPTWSIRFIHEHQWIGPRNWHRPLCAHFVPEDGLLQNDVASGEGAMPKAKAKAAGKPMAKPKAKANAAGQPKAKAAGQPKAKAAGQPKAKAKAAVMRRPSSKLLRRPAAVLRRPGAARD